MKKRNGLRALAVAAIGLLPACTAVAPVDCSQFPHFGPETDLDGPALEERRELLASAQSYPAPDREMLAASYALLGDYNQAFEMASLPGGTGNQEEAHLAIVVAAAGNGSLEPALQAADSIRYSRNVARSYLAIAVAQGLAGNDQAARSSIEAAQAASRTMVKQYSYHLLLSWELAQAGDFDRAIEHAVSIDDEYWGYRIHALIRIAWEQSKAGNGAAALQTLGWARSDIAQSEQPVSNGVYVREGWRIRDLKFLLAELYVEFKDYRSAMDLLAELDPLLRPTSHNVANFNRVSAILLWTKIAEATGATGARSQISRLESQAIDDIIVKERAPGFPTIEHEVAKSELIRLLLESGRSELVYEIYQQLEGRSRVSMGTALAQAESSLGHSDRALNAIADMGEWRGQCIALIQVFVELGAQDMREEASRVTELMESERCDRVWVGLPHALYADFAVNSALIGNPAGTCQALKAVGHSEIWRATIAGIAFARVSEGDFDSAPSIVQWANLSGNIGGTDASGILASVGSIDPSSFDQPGIYPPVLGKTQGFSNSQRAIRRNSIWFHDGIWDQ